ncbi:hypothetical protein [Streptomyces sp. NPDC096033]|uniref:hypothetical protein n=1 Tax=Streptomyces sp. NPDC096033 TaxID=3366071 RepID=UPI003830B584
MPRQRLCGLGLIGRVFAVLDAPLRTLHRRGVCPPRVPVPGHWRRAVGQHAPSYEKTEAVLGTKAALANLVGIAPPEDRDAVAVAAAVIKAVGVKEVAPRSPESA